MSSYAESTASPPAYGPGQRERLCWLAMFLPSAVGALSRVRDPFLQRLAGELREGLSLLGGDLGGAVAQG